MIDSGYRRTVEVERTEAQHKQWQESQSQGLPVQSSCQNPPDKADNKQLSEMVGGGRGEGDHTLLSNGMDPSAFAPSPSYNYSK